MASRVVLIVVLLLSAVIPTPLLAGTEAIDPAPEAVAVEPEPTAPPLPEPTPTPEPTVVPTLEPTSVPTIALTPTLVPPAEATATLEPTATPEATATSTATPEPTLTPEPSTLAYALSPSPTCRVVDGGLLEVASGDSTDLLCMSTVSIDGVEVAPANISIDWYIAAFAADGWKVQIAPVVSDTDAVTWSAEPGSLAMLDRVDQRVSSLSETSDVFHQVATVEYIVRLHRLTCTTSDDSLRIEHAVGVNTSDDLTVAEDRSPQPEPLLVTPALLALPEPKVSFDGPLDFGSIGVTSRGLEATTAVSDLRLTITDLDRTCGDWTLSLSSNALSDNTGASLEGSRLVVVTVDGDPLPDGGCDLALGCDLVILPTSGSAESALTLSVGVELRLSEQPDLGTFDTSLQATLEAQPSG